jgi:hypothetical protein
MKVSNKMISVLEVVITHSVMSHKRLLRWKKLKIKEEVKK